MKVASSLINIHSIWIHKQYRPHKLHLQTELQTSARELQNSTTNTNSILLELVPSIDNWPGDQGTIPDVARLMVHAVRMVDDLLNSYIIFYKFFHKSTCMAQIIHDLVCGSFLK